MRALALDVTPKDEGPDTARDTAQQRHLECAEDAAG